LEAAIAVIHIPVAQDSCNNLRAKQADSASHSEQDKKKFFFPEGKGEKKLTDAFSHSKD
jgi:hypothetical protein